MAPSKLYTVKRCLALTVLCCFSLLANANIPSASSILVQLHEQHLSLESGQAIDTKNGDVLLIPGFLSNHSVWQSTIKALTQGYQVHSVSVAGFAGAQPIQNVTVDRIVQDIADYLKEKSLKVSVIGHSMGAFIGYRLAIDYPELIAKLVAVDGVPFISAFIGRNPSITSGTMLDSAQAIKATYQQASSAQMRAMTAKNITIHAKSPVHQQAILDMAEQSDSATAGTIVAELMVSDLREKVAGIKVPVLVLGSSGGFNTQKQHQFVEKLHRQQVANIPQVQIKMNTQARHFIMFDDPEWLNTQLLSFLL